MILPAKLAPPGPPFSQASAETFSPEISASEAQTPQARADLDARAVEALARLDASPTLLLQQGQKALVEGCRLAIRYFRAAFLLALRHGAERLRRGWREARYACLSYIAQILESPRVRSAWAALRRSWNLAASTAAVASPAITSSFSRLHKTPPRRLLSYILLVDLFLGISLVALAVIGGIEFSEARSISPKAARRAALRLNAPPPARPTSTPLPTATPIPTAEPPAPTATPIPIAYAVWEPTLPLEGGWSGADTCSGTFFAPVGSGAFIWPTDDHYLSGRDFISYWHPGLDIATLLDAPIYAADAGVVVYAGWNTWGYGKAVIIDHGNGWHTLYAHLNQVNVSCGQAVYQGSILGLAGSTGHSTGPHLHFEMRNGTGRVNPWDYLP